MAEKSPIVLTNGEPEELQSGDALKGGSLILWIPYYISNTPFKVEHIQGQDADSFDPGFNVTLLELKIQAYSENAVQSKIRVRLWRWDANGTTNRLILTVSLIEVSVGFHNAEDLTPDLTYNQTDSSAGDGFWLEVDDGSGSKPTKVSEISIQYKFQG